MPQFDVTWWVPLVGALGYFVLGAAWYTALAAPWMAAQGLTKQQIVEGTGNQAPIYGLQLLSTVALAFGVAYVVVALGIDTVGGGMAAGILLAVIAILASTGDFLYEQRRGWKLFWINSGYRLVGITFVGTLAGEFG